jgi:hypothetical protein
MNIGVEYLVQKHLSATIYRLALVSHIHKLQILVLNFNTCGYGTYWKSPNHNYFGILTNIFTSKLSTFSNIFLYVKHEPIYAMLYRMQRGQVWLNAYTYNLQSAAYFSSVRQFVLKLQIICNN